MQFTQGHLFAHIDNEYVLMNDLPHTPCQNPVMSQPVVQEKGS